MLLTCDVGNSSIKLGIYDDDKRIAFGIYPKNDFACGTDILSLTSKSNLRYDQFNAVIISSVIPEYTDSIKEFIVSNFNVEPIIIDNSSTLSITIDPEFNEPIGPDILCMSSYAYSKYKKASIIISIGTATVFTYVNAHGVLKGCAIAPGFKSFSTSLSEKSAMLPSFTPSHKDKHLATNTVDAMSIGAFNGYIGMVNHLLKRIQEETNYESEVILCGGHSDKVKEYIKDINYQETDFVTSALNDIYNRFYK